MLETLAWSGQSVVLFPEVIYLCVTASWSSSKNVTEKTEFFYFYYTSFTLQDSIVGVDELVTILLQSLENVSQFDRVTRQLYSYRP